MTAVWQGCDGMLIQWFGGDREVVDYNLLLFAVFYEAQSQHGVQSGNFRALEDFVPTTIANF